MKLVPVLFLLTIAAAGAAEQIPNPLIDAQGFQKIVMASMKERQTHRLTEEAFIKALSDSDTVVLDARSADKFALRHVKGAVNLPFTDFTAASLAGAVPSKDTRIVIYCNNNFLSSPESFTTKVAPASLNLSTYPALKAYGYVSVYELGPVLDVRKTAIPFEGSEMK